MGQCCSRVQNKISDEDQAQNKANRAFPNNNTIVLNQQQFVFEHINENIRDQYQISKVLGTGAYGEVRLCTHRKTGARRAVKIINKSYLDEEESKRFLEELEILKKLDHPNIVKLYEIYQDAKRYFAVMEYCSGGELFDQIIQRPYYSERDAAIIMKQLLSGVSYCHSMKIVHRDLKPENMLLDSNKSANIKIIDFGTSQVYDPQSHLKHKFGTPYYIAPEVLQGKYTEKCDVWSCGVIMYVLVCGTTPFTGRDDGEVIMNVTKGLYKIEGPIWAKISADAINLVQKMLTFNPDKRISATDALQHPWLSTNIDSLQMNEVINSEALSNLRKFNANTKMQQAALKFLTTHMVSKKEKEELMKVFQVLDKNGDGKLSKEELIQGYSQTMDAQSAEVEMQRIMELADVDLNGKIDYTEFITATIDKKKLLSKDRLRAAFQLFDSNGDAYISPDELKQILDLGRKLDEEVWKKMVSEVDLNQDGEISYEEFEIIMTKLFETGSYQ
eukprot:403375554